MKKRKDKAAAALARKKWAKDAGQTARSMREYWATLTLEQRRARTAAALKARLANQALLRKLAAQAQKK
jgi:hypothetical protein